MKIDDLFWSVSIKEDGSTKVLNDLQSKLKAMQNIIIDINGVVNKDTLAKPFSMQAMTIEQAVNQAKLLEQAYKKIEFPYLDKDAELMRQRWQEIQAELAKYGQLIKSSVMEQSTSVQITEREKQIRQEIADIVGKTGLVQTDAAKKIVQEQVALSALKTERQKLAEAERLGIVSSDNLATAKARITEQERLHKATIASLESDLRNEIKMNQAAAGSMDQLSLKLVKLRNDYRALSEVQRNGVVGQGMLKEIQGLDQQLKDMDTTIGNNHRRIGDYASGFNGLGMSIQQVARELPSLKFGFGMFMLAISNNLPILSDELERASKSYKALKAEGKTAVPVWQQVVRSIMSWQTVMVVAITLLTVFGKEISNWVVGLFRSKNALDEVKESLDKVKESLSSSLSSELAEMERLFGVLRSAEKGTRDYNNAKQDILSKYGQYLNGLSQEVSALNDVEGAYKAVTDAIYESARAKAMDNFASEQMQTFLDTQMSGYEKIRSMFIDREGEETGSIVFKQIKEAFEKGELEGWMKQYIKRFDKGLMNIPALGVVGNDVQKALNDITKAQSDYNERLKVGNDLFNDLITNRAGYTKKEKPVASAKYVGLYDELKAVQDIQFMIEQARISAMQDGSEKTLAQMELNHKKEMAQIERMQQEELNRLIQHEKQKFEANPANKGKTFNASGISLSPDRLAAYDALEVATTSKQQSELQKYYKDSLDKYRAYAQTRLDIMKKYQEDRNIVLSAGGDEGNLAEVDRKEKEALEATDKMFGERAENFQHWANTITNLTLEGLVDMLGKVQAQLNIARMNAGKDGGMGDDNSVAMYRAQILRLTSEIEKLSGKNKEIGTRGYSEWRKLSTILSRVGNEFETIGKEVGGTVGEIISAAGAVASSTTSMINGVTALAEDSVNAAKKAAGEAVVTMTALEKASVVLTIISAALKVMNMIGGALDSLKDAERDREEALKVLISLQDAYNKSLIESKLLQDEVFGTNAIGNMFDAMEALNMATKNYNETLNETQKRWKDPDSNFFDKLYQYGTIMGWAGDRTVNSNTGDASLRENLRYITKKSSNGFFGIGGNHTKTQNLEDWVRENMGEELFLEDGRLNLDLAINLVENSADRLPEQTKESLERLIEFERLAQEAEQAMKDYISETFGALGDSITEDIVNAFRNGEDAAESFGDSVGEVLETIGRQVVRNFFMKKALDQLEKDIYPVYEQFSKDGDTEAFANNIVGILDTFIENTEAGIDASNIFLQKLEDEAAKKGIDIFKPEESKGQLESGYARASQESIDTLTGATLSSQGILSDMRNNSFALNMNISAQTNELKRQTTLLDSMNSYSEEIRDLNLNLPRIYEVLDRTYRNGTPIRD